MREEEAQLPSQKAKSSMVAPARLALPPGSDGSHSRGQTSVWCQHTDGGEEPSCRHTDGTLINHTSPPTFFFLLAIKNSQTEEATVWTETTMFPITSFSCLLSCPQYRHTAITYDQEPTPQKTTPDIALCSLKSQSGQKGTLGHSKWLLEASTQAELQKPVQQSVWSSSKIFCQAAIQHRVPWSAKFSSQPKRTDTDFTVYNNFIAQRTSF